MKRFFWLAITAFSCITSMALAEPRTARATQLNAQPNAVNPWKAIKVHVDIVGRPQKPLPAVEVARLRPMFKLSELKPSFVDRVSEAQSKDPF